VNVEHGAFSARVLEVFSADPTAEAAACVRLDSEGGSASGIRDGLGDDLESSATISAVGRDREFDAARAIGYIKA
jgi:hypothetical protein